VLHADGAGSMLAGDVEQQLVAVLTHLSDQYGDVSGHWYEEAKFGLLEGLDHSTYADLDVNARQEKPSLDYIG
jgi:hypothetical protein